MKKTIIALGLSICSAGVFANPLDFKVSPYKYTVPKKVEQICQKNKDNCPVVEVDVVKTNYPWLDTILNGNDKKEKIKAFFKEAENNPTPANNYQWIHRVDVLGNSQNLLEFITINYVYMGGAHGLETDTHTVVDVTTKKKLTLDTLVINNKAQKALEEKLYQQFLAYAGDNKEYLQQWKFFMTDNFYFDQDNLVFSYQPYEIGPYSAGVIELKLAKKDLQQIIQPKYLQEMVKIDPKKLTAHVEE